MSIELIGHKMYVIPLHDNDRDEICIIVNTKKDGMDHVCKIPAGYLVEALRSHMSIRHHVITLLAEVIPSYDHCINGDFVRKAQFKQEHVSKHNLNKNPILTL